MLHDPAIRKQFPHHSGHGRFPTSPPADEAKYRASSTQMNVIHGLSQKLREGLSTKAIFFDGVYWFVRPGFWGSHTCTISDDIR